MLTNTPAPETVYAPTAPPIQNTPQPTITPTPIPTQTNTIENSSTGKFEGQETNLTAQANQTLPIEYYPHPSDIYPWMKNGTPCYDDKSEYPWMWSQEKYKYYIGDGDTGRIASYEQSVKAKQIVVPKISVQILHNDDKTPYNFDRETIILGNTYDGYFKFTNDGDQPFQGDVTVVANASLFFGGTMLHMENQLVKQYLSLYPKQSNDFYKRWEIKDFNGAPIPTGAFNIQLDIRDLNTGRTIYTMTVRPMVARDPNHDGLLTF